MTQKKYFFRYLLLVVSLFYSTILCAQYTSIPDPLFEQVLVEQFIDSDQVVNGQVLTNDISDEIMLVIDQNYITSFEGLQDFTSLEILTIYSGNQATEINLAQNVYLKQATLYGFNNISSLNLTNNTALESLKIFSNSLTNIDISACINLNILELTLCPISSINLTNNINLKSIGLSTLNITSLDLTNNILLEKILLYSLYLTALDFSQNSNLDEVDLYNLGGPITIFDGSVFYNNINLKKITIRYVSFYPEINLQNNVQLEYLLLWYTGLFNLDVTNNTQLKFLRVDNNFLNSIILEPLTQLEIFGCTYNNMTYLNLDNNPLIELLYCHHNDLQELSIQNGANSLLNGLFYPFPTFPDTFNNRFIATNNPYLGCIFVDDVANCNANWPEKDSTSHYVSTLYECDNLQNEQFVTDEFKIYPNPVNDIVFIDNTNNIEIKKIIVYDLLGKAVIELKGTNLQINLSSLTSGLYLIKIETEKEAFVKKIIKK